VVCWAARRETDVTTPATVEEYLASLPEDSRLALETLRETIRAAAPDATEAISYQMPAFKDNGRLLVSYAAFKEHCSLFPASMSVIEAYRDELEPYVSGRGTLRFRPDHPIPAVLVQKIVTARLEENVARRRR
jgi:uncharacterized protein YdhG (YjbR/CyaY superfamily)